MKLPELFCTVIRTTLIYLSFWAKISSLCSKIPLWAPKTQVKPKNLPFYEPISSQRTSLQMKSIKRCWNVWPRPGADLEGRCAVWGEVETEGLKVGHAPHSWPHCCHDKEGNSSWLNWGTPDETSPGGLSPFSCLPPLWLPSLFITCHPQLNIFFFISAMISFEVNFWFEMCKKFHNQLVVGFLKDFLINCLKGIVLPKINILPSFTQPRHSKLFFSVKHKKVFF